MSADTTPKVSRLEEELLKRWLRRPSLPPSSRKGKRSQKPGEYPEDDPHGAMQLAWEQLRSEYPAETSYANLEPMSLLSQMVFPRDFIAVAYPFISGGRVRYNPSLVSGDPATNRETLVHELTHVNQSLRNPWWSRFFTPLQEVPIPYFERPREVEATRAQARSGRRVDIELPAKEKRK